jgi:hypothetical protein
VGFGAGGATVPTRRLGGRARRWDTAELARRVGLGSSVTRLWASLDRLHTFYCVTFVATDVATVRLELPTLTPNQLNQLPTDMAETYSARFLA